MAEGWISRFSGQDPESWIDTVDGYFIDFQIPYSAQVDIASQFLDGAAELWAKRNTHLTNWCAFSYQLLWEFDPTKKPVENELEVEDEKLILNQEVADLEQEDPIPTESSSSIGISDEVNYLSNSVVIVDKKSNVGKIEPMCSSVSESSVWIWNNVFEESKNSVGKGNNYCFNLSAHQMFDPLPARDFVFCFGERLMCVVQASFQFDGGGLNPVHGKAWLMSGRVEELFDQMLNRDNLSYFIKLFRLQERYIIDVCMREVLSSFLGGVSNTSKAASLKVFDPGVFYEVKAVMDLYLVFGLWFGHSRVTCRGYDCLGKVEFDPLLYLAVTTLSASMLMVGDHQVIVETEKTGKTAKDNENASEDVAVDMVGEVHFWYLHFLWDPGLLMGSWVWSVSELFLEEKAVEMIVLSLGKIFMVQNCHVGMGLDSGISTPSPFSILSMWIFYAVVRVSLVVDSMLLVTLTIETLTHSSMNDKDATSQASCDRALNSNVLKDWYLWIIFSDYPNTKVQHGFQIQLLQLFAEVALWVQLNWEREKSLFFLLFYTDEPTTRSVPFLLSCLHFRWCYDPGIAWISNLSDHVRQTVKLLVPGSPIFCWQSRGCYDLVSNVSGDAFITIFQAVHAKTTTLVRGYYIVHFLKHFSIGSMGCGILSDIYANTVSLMAVLAHFYFDPRIMSMFNKEFSDLLMRHEWISSLTQPPFWRIWGVHRYFIRALFGFRQVVLCVDIPSCYPTTDLLWSRYHVLVFYSSLQDVETNSVWCSLTFPTVTTRALFLFLGLHWVLSLFYYQMQLHTSFYWVIISWPLHCSMVRKRGQCLCYGLNKTGSEFDVPTFILHRLQIYKKGKASSNGVVLVRWTFISELLQTGPPLLLVNHEFMHFNDSAESDSGTLKEVHHNSLAASFIMWLWSILSVGKQVSDVITQNIIIHVLFSILFISIQSHCKLVGKSYPVRETLLLSRIEEVKIVLHEVIGKCLAFSKVEYEASAFLLCRLDYDPGGYTGTVTVYSQGTTVFWLLARTFVSFLLACIFQRISGATVGYDDFSAAAKDRFWSVKVARDHYSDRNILYDSYTGGTYVQFRWRHHLLVENSPVVGVDTREAAGLDYSFRTDLHQHDFQLLGKWWYGINVGLENAGAVTAMNSVMRLCILEASSLSLCILDYDPEGNTNIVAVYSHDVGYGDISVGRTAWPVRNVQPLPDATHIAALYWAVHTLTLPQASVFARYFYALSSYMRKAASATSIHLAANIHGPGNTVHICSKGFSCPFDPGILQVVMFSRVFTDALTFSQLSTENSTYLYARRVSIIYGCCLCGALLNIVSHNKSWLLRCIIDDVILQVNARHKFFRAYQNWFRRGQNKCGCLCLGVGNNTPYLPLVSFHILEDKDVSKGMGMSYPQTGPGTRDQAQQLK